MGSWREYCEKMLLQFFTIFYCGKFLGRCFLFFAPFGGNILLCRIVKNQIGNSGLKIIEGRHGPGPRFGARTFVRSMFYEHRASKTQTSLRLFASGGAPRQSSHSRPIIRRFASPSSGRRLSGMRLCRIYKNFAKRHRLKLIANSEQLITILRLTSHFFWFPKFFQKKS